MPMTFRSRGTDVDDVALADLTITQGDDLSIYIDVEDSGLVVPLTGYSALLQVRDDAGNVVLAFDSAASPATIVITEAIGRITFSQTAATTGALTPGCYSYDLQLTDAAGLDTTELRGKCTIVKDISRVAVAP